MKEKVFDISNINQTVLFGVNEKNLQFIRLLFSDLTITVRFEKMTVKGEENLIKNFETFYNKLLSLYNKKKNIDEKLIMSAFRDEEIKPENADTLLYGANGYAIKAKTKNQQQMVKDIEKKDMIFAIGPAGSGKTYTAVALAVKFLKEKRVKRIILTRPAVEAGENLGFLPGDLKEKLDPYLQPLYDALRDMLSQSRLDEYIEHHIIEIAPLAFMRGRTLENSFVILDEAQNATQNQIKMFLTRMGNYSKFIITGDPSQTDLPHNQPSGLLSTVELLKDIDGISVIFLTNSDIVRNPLVSKIVSAFENNDKR
ncbi:MAG: PhoH family protein [Bacteroidales bacterium]|nr:PhoH family protein [Bacteroidales bacterium]